MLARLGTMEPMSTQQQPRHPQPPVASSTAVIFDLGGVMTEPLFHHRTDVPPEFFGVIAFFLGEFRDHYHLTTGVHDLHLLEMGKISDDEFFDRMIARYIEAGNEPVDPRDAQQFVFGQGMVACGAMVDAVRQIRDAGYKTALLTNISREGEAIFTKLFPVDELFDVVVDSSKVGMRKPDPAIYRLTCERLGVAARALSLHRRPAVQRRGGGARSACRRSSASTRSRSPTRWSSACSVIPQPPRPGPERDGRPRRAVHRTARVSHSRSPGSPTAGPCAPRTRTSGTRGSVAGWQTPRCSRSPTAWAATRAGSSRPKRPSPPRCRC